MVGNIPDHEKMDRFADNLGFNAETRTSVHNVLDKLLLDMQTEDPEALIYCSCHGELHPQKDVDVWGLCSFSR